MADGTEHRSGGSSTRVFTVMHPLAGNYDVSAVRRTVERNFGRIGWDYEIYETTGNEDLPKLVREALGRGFNLFVVAGGDGTVSDVAEALVHTSIPLGIIPVGTGNVMARDLWIPMSANRACNLITGDHNIAMVDAMQVGDCYYFLNLSAGFASLMIRDTRREHKRIFGVAAYIWTGLTKLLGFQPRSFEIEVDGTVNTYWASEVTVANSGILAMRPFYLGRGIRTDDGHLDICIIRARTVLDYLGLAVRIVMRLQKRDRNIEYQKVEHGVVIKADEKLVVQADGEVVGETPIEVKVVPGAVKVIAPRRRRKLSLWNIA